MIGPALGGTIVALSGARFDAATAAGRPRCLFEVGSLRRAVAANETADNGGGLVCIAPALDELREPDARDAHGAAATYAAAFGGNARDPLASARVHGGAHFGAGVLRLRAPPPPTDVHVYNTPYPRTAAGVWQHEPAAGTAPLRLFRASMQIVLDGDEEHGLCVRLGPPQPPTASVRGCAGGGLGVLLHVSNSRCRAEEPARKRHDQSCSRRGLRVRLDGARLYNSTVGRSLADGSLTPRRSASRSPASTTRGRRRAAPGARAGAVRRREPRW